MQSRTVPFLWRMTIHLSQICAIDCLTAEPASCEVNIGLVLVVQTE